MRRLSTSSQLRAFGLPSSLATYRHSSGNNSSEPQTYFDYLDRMWNGGSSAKAATAVPQELDVTANVFESTFMSVRDSLGLESWLAVLMFGGLVRLSTLYFSLRGERAAARMHCALPLLKPAHEKFQRVYYNDSVSALEVQQAATVLKSVRKSIYAQHRTSNLKTLTGLVGTPFVLQGFYWTSKLMENVHLDVGTSSFLWCSALNMPDPFFVLPVVSCCLTLLNLEITLSTREELKKGMMGTLIWGGRVMCLCAIPAVIHFRSGVLLYWIGMSTVGLLQPILLRVPAFRKWFQVPDIPKPSDSNEDLLQRRLTVEVPYLSYLFESEKEMNVKMIKPEATVLRGKQGTATAGSARASLGHERQLGKASATLTEQMESVEKSDFRKMYEREKLAVSGGKGIVAKGKGAAFASGGGAKEGGDMRSAKPAPFSEEDLLPDAFKKSKN